MKNWHDDITDILERANRAPSGDNTQPWRFVVRAHECEIWHHTEIAIERIHGEVFDYLTIGTLIENITITASTLGYTTHISYTQMKTADSCLAKIQFVPESSAVEHPLTHAVYTRYTNRYSFMRKPLTEHDRIALATVETDTPDITLKLIEENLAMKRIVSFSTTYERMLFSIRMLHAQFFHLVNWRRVTDARRRIGFYFPSLGLPLPKLIGFWILQHWWVARMGTFIHLHRLIAWLQGHTYLDASAMGIISGSGNSHEDWLRAGRTLERIWLTAEKEGLCFQPLSGALLLRTAMQDQKYAHTFSPQERHLIESSYQHFMEAEGLTGRVVYFMFRVGYGKRPHWKSTRKDIHDMITFAS